MSLKSEKINERLIRHFSDEGCYIKQVETGIEYSEAVDVIPCKYTYEETDKPIEINEKNDESEEKTDESE